MTKGYWPWAVGISPSEALANVREAIRVYIARNKGVWETREPPKAYPRIPGDDDWEARLQEYQLAYPNRPIPEVLWVADAHIHR